jgi:hypothetical protein
LHFVPTNVEYWVWYQPTWISCHFPWSSKLKVGKVHCSRLQLLRISAFEHNHRFISSCTSQLVHRIIKYMPNKLSTFCVMSVVIHVYKFCMKLFFCMWTIPDTEMMRNFEVISDKFNVMVICACGICVQNKSLNCIIIIL